jgi:hypothetical protein
MEDVFGGEQTVEDQQKFDACMRIVENFTEIRKNRQDYEWKFTIAFWTLIVAAIFNSRNMPLFSSLCMRLWIATIALFIYGVFWLVGVHSGHGRDREIGKHYLAGAENILATHKIGLPPVEKSPLFQQWGLFFQFAVSALLLLVFVLSD